MLFIRNLAEVFVVAATGRFPATAVVLDISDTRQYLDHDKSSSVLQVIKGKLKDLQKLLKYFNGTTTSVFNVLLSPAVLATISVLYSKDLLVGILWLFIL